MEIIKNGENAYTINLTYNELSLLYHYVGSYYETLNDIISRQWGVHLTGAESYIHDKADEISKELRIVEPRLYSDLRFEDKSYEQV